MTSVNENESNTGGKKKILERRNVLRPSDDISHSLHVAV